MEALRIPRAMSYKHAALDAKDLRSKKRQSNIGEIDILRSTSGGLCIAPQFISRFLEVSDCITLASVASFLTRR